MVVTRIFLFTTPDFYTGCKPKFFRPGRLLQSKYPWSVYFSRACRQPGRCPGKHGAQARRSRGRPKVQWRQISTTVNFSSSFLLCVMNQGGRRWQCDHHILLHLRLCSEQNIIDTGEDSVLRTRRKHISFIQSRKSSDSTLLKTWYRNRTVTTFQVRRSLSTSTVSDYVTTWLSDGFNKLKYGDVHDRSHCDGTPFLLWQLTHSNEKTLMTSPRMSVSPSQREWN